MRTAFHSYILTTDDCIDMIWLHTPSEPWVGFIVPDDNDGSRRSAAFREHETRHTARVTTLELGWIS